MSVVALLTDFGQRDPFVGVMKGVISGLAPKVSVVDLCHEVPPQDVRTGAFFLAQSVSYFPKGTVFVAVVDPGVGSSRRILAAKTKSHLFLAPDNGLLSWVDGIVEHRELPVPKGASATFHGRDVFAPAAARLAKGLWPATVGEHIADPVTLPWPEGEILSIDRFGNAITSLKKAAAVKHKGKVFPVKRTYADVGEGEELAYVGSCGLIELSVRNGNFAAKRGAKRGDKVDDAG